MSQNPDELIRFISDGGAVDWNGLESSAGTPEEKDELTRLRKVYQIAEFNRTIQRSPDALPGESAQGAAEHHSPLAIPPQGSWGPLTPIEKIGEGTFGEVWRAWEERLKREVALKLLRPADAGREAAERRLLDEGSHLARIRHSGVAQVYGLERHDGKVGLWMELLDGETLERIVKDRGALSAGEATVIGVDLCHALAAVHAVGLVHRDVKAANVVRTRGGRNVLADFGLGQLLDMSRNDEALSGTPMYMAPEVLEGEPAMIPSDIYSLGVLLFHLVTARYPGEATTVTELREIRRSGRERRLRDVRPDLPLPFIRIVERAMAFNPSDRFQTAGELEAALVRVGEPESPTSVSPVPATSHSWRNTGMMAMVLVVLMAAAVTLLRSRDPAAPAGSAAYDVEAAFVRFDGSAYRHLASGDRVRPGDRVALEFRASLPVHVYVLNEDERGETYLLFPQPAYELENPVPPGVLHRLPGTMDGDETAWKVTSAGGREHFLVLASPEPLSELEKEIESVAAPEEGRPVSSTGPAPISPKAGEALRGLGGLEKLSNRPAASGMLSDMVRRLSGRESGITGVWIRKFVLENPDR